MRIETVESPDDPRLAAFRDLKDARSGARAGLFVVEGRANLRRLLGQSRLPARSLLLTPTALAALRPELEAFDAPLRVLVASREHLRNVAGFDVHRGCVGLAERREPASFEELLASRPKLLLALEQIADPQNVGGLFRNAQAFGAEAVLLCPRTCDPLYRRAIRVSMGASLLVPFARCSDWPGPLKRLRDAGYRVVALHPGPAATPITDAAPSPELLALLLGTEGDGLSQGALALAGDRVRIPMAPGVDSLNVATASGIALHHFTAAARFRPSAP